MIAAENVLDIAALVDPSKIVAKMKYHLLAHLKDDIIRFGPLVGVASEVFESFNAIFRYCSIYSNHLAPSRDIARQLSGQEALKRILSGGWWLNRGSGNWVRPGPSVQAFVKGNDVLKSLVGWPTAEKSVSGECMKQSLLSTRATGTDANPGSIQLMPVKRNENRTKQPRKAVAWKDTLAISAINSQDMYAGLDVVWYHGKLVISKANDKCTMGAWVFAHSPYSVSSDSLQCLVTQLITSQRHPPFYHQ